MSSVSFILLPLTYEFRMIMPILEGDFGSVLVVTFLSNIFTTVLLPRKFHHNLQAAECAIRENIRSESFQMTRFSLGA